MPTPTDPYNSSDRLVEADDVLEPLADQAIPDVASSAQEAAIASAADMSPNVQDVQGSLSFDEKPVEVTQVSESDVFDESAELTEAGDIVSDASVQATDLPERPEATLADGSAYAPSPAATRFNEFPSELDASYEQSVTSAPSVGDNAQWVYDSEPLEALPEAPKSRLKVHIGIFFATIILVPIAWYLFSDASVRLAYPLNEKAPWNTGSYNILAIGETVGALVVLALIWFLARASSLGVFCSGVLVTILGAIGVAVPDFARSTIVGGIGNAIGDFNNFTGNVAFCFDLDMGSGRLLVYGFLLLMTGVVSHYARRRGVIAGKQQAQRDIALGK